MRRVTMRTQKLFSAVFFALASVVAGGCAPSPKEVAAQVSTDTKALLGEAIDTTRLTNDWESVDQAYTSTGASSSSRPKVSPARQTDESLAHWSQFADSVFDEANIVDRPPGALVFGLSGSMVCTAGDSTITPDPECVKNVDTLELRLKVTGSYDFTLQVGPKHIEPLVLQLRAKKSIAVVTDLARLRETVDFVNSKYASAPVPGQLSTLTRGRVELKLEKNGEHDFTLSQSNLDDVFFSITHDGAERSYSSRARSPIYAVRIEGPAKKATVSVDQGPITAHFFQRDISSSTTGLGAPLLLSLSGFSGTLVLAEGSPVRLSHLGLGDGQSTLTSNGTNLLTVDLNASTGRHFDVTAQGIDGGARFEVTPGFELKVAATLAQIFGTDAIEAGVGDTSYTAAFTASSGQPTIDFISTALAQVDGGTTWYRGARIINGTVHLEAVNGDGSADSREFDACFVSTSADAGHNAFVTSFNAASCP